MGLFLLWQLSPQLNRMRFSGGGLPFFFAATMASIDAIMLALIKYISIEKHYIGLIALPMIAYSLQPVLFYLSMEYETLTVMNLLFDVISDVLITIVGLLLFKETIGPYKKLGVIFSFISIILLSLNDGT